MEGLEIKGQLLEFMLSLKLPFLKFQVTPLINMFNVESFTSLQEDASNAPLCSFYIIFVWVVVYILKSFMYFLYYYYY